MLQTREIVLNFIEYAFLESFAALFLAEDVWNRRADGPTFAIDAQARAQKLTQSDRHLLRGAGVYHITVLLVGGKGLNLSLLPAYLGQSCQTVSLS